MSLKLGKILNKVSVDSKLTVGTGNRCIPGWSTREYQGKFWTFNIQWFMPVPKHYCW